MGVEANPSKFILTRDSILERLTGLEIFKFYNPDVSLVKDFCSDLRRDKTPSCRVQLWEGVFFYKDFATGDSYNCFGYVMKKFGCSYAEALKIIDRDFNLGLSNAKIAVKPVRKEIKEEVKEVKKKRKVITWIKRGFNTQDRDIWKVWGISIQTLIYFDVVPIKAFFVDGERTNTTSISPAYLYKLFGRAKIYRPLEAVGARKWRSNTYKTDIQGWKQLPQKGRLLILTSSLKDVMVLYEMGYNAIALHTESEVPNEDMMQVLKQRFDKIIVLYDNDWNKEKNWGQIGAQKIVNKYNLKNVMIPSQYQSSDPTDLVYNIGYEKAETIIQNLCN